MAKVGEGTYFASGFEDDIDTRPYIRIGKYCQIARGVTFFDRRNHPCIRHPEYVANYPTDILFGGEESERGGEYDIGSDVWIGENAVIMSGTKIGDGAIVGAYSVVKGKVPSYAVVVGNPAELIRYRFQGKKESGVSRDYQTTIKKLQQIQWWNWTKEQISERKEDFLDIDRFIQKYEHQE